MSERAIPKLDNFGQGELEALYLIFAVDAPFSIDWFTGISEIPLSSLFAVISFLENKKWIELLEDLPGFYTWKSRLSPDQFFEKLPLQDTSRYFRKAVQILTSYLPKNDENVLRIASICLRAGVGEDDIETLLKAADIEEKKHHIAPAIRYYEGLLKAVEDKMGADPCSPLSDEICRMFITAAERRAGLSMLHPNIKNIGPWLMHALSMAARLKDLRSLASLQLLIGQNHWMMLQYKEASAHFDKGWEMVQALNDPKLKKRALQLQGLKHFILGELSETIRFYDLSLGDLEQNMDDDFSLIIGLHVSQCYSQAGMPQRGLGLAESIFKTAEKQGNGPLAGFAIVCTGLIFLEMGRNRESLLYLEKALNSPEMEIVPMAEIFAGIGLAHIKCSEGKIDEAADYFNLLYKIKKSSWYHTLNSSHIFEPGFILIRNGNLPVELNRVGYLDQMARDEMNPLIYSIFRRLKIKYLEADRPVGEKVAELQKIEASLEKMGALMELAKTRTDMARIYRDAGSIEKAKTSAKMAWQFLQGIAKTLYPSDLEDLVKTEIQKKETRLSEFVISMGEALGKIREPDHLLSSIINPILKMCGAEQVALFIIDPDTKSLRLAASRNIAEEDLAGKPMQKTMESIQKMTGSQNPQPAIEERIAQDHYHMHRSIIVPLLLGEKMKGVLFQCSRFFNFDINDEALRLLSAVGSQIALAIDHANAYSEISRLNEQLIEENLYYKETQEEVLRFGELVGSSPEMIELHGLIHKISGTSSTVLIEGETGVGKELVARAIHRQSTRVNGPFIRVNCAALPETLMDSELFGHERGAFTGAMASKPGRFELAHRGTLFLDEISELPLTTQGKLLRVLQEKEFQRVGGTKTLSSDFRLIAATNRDLEKEVAAGRFRPDLFFRLNVFPIKIPSLRRRKGDIVPLTMHFLRIFCAQHNKSFKGINQAEMEKLRQYSWPGNVRELANVIERAVILGDSRLTFSSLGHPAPRQEILDGELLFFKDMERKHILKALARSRGKVAGNNGAAALLGLQRTTLINKMIRLGIYPPDKGVSKFKQ